jgi:hypothetical protein
MEFRNSQLRDSGKNTNFGIIEVLALRNLGINAKFGVYIFVNK